MDFFAARIAKRVVDPSKQTIFELFCTKPPDFGWAGRTGSSTTVSSNAWGIYRRSPITWANPHELIFAIIVK
ncbi:MAG: hypothetical protein DMG39_14800 [Acidobacteria bacterium]|nr:MAG: hypothetical protein DMG39_14800 [Acidobacteriota bacterium]